MSSQRPKDKSSNLNQCYASNQLASIEPPSCGSMDSHQPTLTADECRRLDPNCQSCVGLASAMHYGAPSNQSHQIDGPQTSRSGQTSRGIKRFGDGRQVIDSLGQMHHASHQLTQDQNRTTTNQQTPIVGEPLALIELRQDSSGYNKSVSSSQQPGDDDAPASDATYQAQQDGGEVCDYQEENSEFDYEPVLTKILNEKKLALFNSPDVMNHLRKYYNKNGSSSSGSSSQ